MRPEWVPNEARISPKWGQDGRRMRPKWMKNEARMDGEWGPNGLRMRPEWMRNEMEEGSGWIPAWMDWWIESYRGRIGEGLRPDWRGIEAWMTSDRIWYRQFVVGPERWIPDVTYSVSYPGALLLMYLNTEEDAFWALSVLMSDRTHAMHGFFIPGKNNWLRNHYTSGSQICHFQWSV